MTPKWANRIRKNLILRAGFSITLAILCNRAAAQEDSDCLACHATPGMTLERDGRTLSLFVDAKRAAGSVHAGLSCIDCHVELDGVDAYPHSSGLDRVDCGECHEEAMEVYQKHGRLDVGADPDIPRCSHCHGTHDILPSSDRQSHVHPANLPDTCRACHTDVDLVKKHDVLRDAPIKLYQNSVHGQAASNGVLGAATCRDCHSSATSDGARTAHRILGAVDPDSTIFHSSIPDTCGQCHPTITEAFWDGIHGQLAKRGAVDAPVCTHCHGEHGIVSPDDPRSPVSAARVAQETCTPCHESAVLNEKYGISAGGLHSYIDSYHGLKSKSGDVRVANCASCHGAHRILPSSDPASSINPANLKNTCGECHTDISAELANTSIHETTVGSENGWPGFFTSVYMWLIGVTIGLMVLHNVADWYRHMRHIQKQPFVIRLTAGETAQHWMLMLSFIVLVVSGFSLRFSESWWVQLLFGWGGGEGFLIRGTIHRIAATVFVICGVWHFLYLFTRRGRGWLTDMLLGKRDLIDIKQSAQYFLGLRERKPSFGRFSYMEKTEYWALIWGSVIMGITGVALWFDNYFVDRWDVSKTILDVCLVVHYYEAWLATLAILVWHIYATVLNPSVYPMNPAWLTGRMPKDLYDEEHPEGPKLKARVYRARHQDETETACVNSQRTETSVPPE